MESEIGSGANAKSYRGLLAVAGILITIAGSHTAAHANPYLNFSASAEADSGIYNYTTAGRVPSNHVATSNSGSASYSSGVNSFALNEGAPDNQIVETLSAPGGLKVPQTWDTKGTVSTSGSVGFGALHADISAQTQVTYSTTLEGYTTDPSTGQQIPYSVTYLTPIGASALAAVTEDADDTLTVTSDKYAPGTLVPVQLSLALHASANAPTVTTSFGTSFQPSIDVFIGAPFGISDSNGNLLIGGIELHSADGSLNATKSATVDLPVGYTFGAYLHLEASVYAGGFDCCGYPLPGESASLDIGNTVDLFVDPLTSDVAISSASGHDYSTPTHPSSVPEPGALTVVGGALAALGLVQRRRRA